MSKVLKFGGTSLGTPRLFKQSLDIATASIKIEKTWIVVSALGGVTNALISMAENASQRKFKWKQLFADLKSRHIQQFLCLGESTNSLVFKNLFDELETHLLRLEKSMNLTLQTLDVIMSFGERFSSKLFADGLQLRGITSTPIDSYKFIKTNSQFGDASINYPETILLASKLLKDYPDTTLVITGFLGSDDQDQITTLGRSGSDFTAGLVGYLFDADRVEIWTDVDGVFTTDPNRVNSAKHLPILSYDYMGFMAESGAKVLHPKTVNPLRLKHIPLKIKNTFNPNCQGSLIGEFPDSHITIHTISVTRSLFHINADLIDKHQDLEGLNFILEHSIEIQKEVGVSGYILKKEHENLTILKDLINKNIRDVAKITLLTNSSFQIDEIIEFRTLLSDNHIELLGHSYDTHYQISFYVDDKNSNRALYVLHEFWCVGWRERVIV